MALFHICGSDAQLLFISVPSTPYSSTTSDVPPLGAGEEKAAPKSTRSLGRRAIGTGSFVFLPYSSVDQSATLTSLYETTRVTPAISLVQMRDLALVERCSHL